MIYTSNYRLSKNVEKTVSISGDGGRSVGYNGEYFRELAPKKVFWDIWHNNIGNIEEIENDRFYVREYIKNVLINLSAFNTYQKLDGYTLLCFEENDKFCHRHIVSAWLEDQLDIIVPEVKYEDEHMILLSKPNYIKKLYLEEKHLLKK